MKNLEQEFKLWYNKPAKKWTEALPIGNGRLGAMVFGRVNKELIQLNEDTLWSGEPKDNNNYSAITHLEEARNLIFEEKYHEAERLVSDKMLGTWNQNYLPLGDLKLTFNSKGKVRNYKRTLDLGTAIASVEYDQNDTKYTREIFTSAVDQALFLKISSNKKKSISLSVSLDSKLKHAIHTEANELILNGNAPKHSDPIYISSKSPIIYEEGKGMRFEIRMMAKLIDGNIIKTRESLSIQNASEVLLILVAATSFNGFNKDPFKDGKNEREICLNTLNKIEKDNYILIRDNHVKDYQELFSRVQFDLGENKFPHLSTDLRLKRINKKNEDIQYVIEKYPDFFDDLFLFVLYFQFGRYLLISSSRPGCQPANLQGIWNKDIRPPWSSNWTLNINTEMNYWPAESCNLSECTEPLFNLIENLRENGSKTAKAHYDCRGWTSHHNADVWCPSIPVSGDPSWAFWPLSAGWLCQHLWEHYKYGCDKDFLKNRAYPIMKDAAIFFLDWLGGDKNGYLITSPSISPENKFKDNKHRKCSVSMASTMDMAIIRDLFRNTINTCKILNRDKEFKEKLENALKILFPYKIGSAGQLLEWYLEFEEVEPGHRHMSHLFGLHPGSEIDPIKTPELAMACKKSIELRYKYSRAGTGWSCAWKINLTARLLEPEMAYSFIVTLLSKSTYSNMFNAHPPFQIDGNFGGTAGIAEMLLQSHCDEIRLLPALPKRWKNGFIKGLRAKGDFTVDIFWNDSKLNQAFIHSSKDGKCKLRIDSPFKISSEEEIIKYDYIEESLIEFTVLKNKSYKIKVNKDKQ